MSFKNLVGALRAVQNKFDPDGAERQRACLGQLARLAFPLNELTAHYHASLLFLAAHPQTRELERRVAAELVRLERFHKARRHERPIAAWADQGMAYVDIVTRFSHDATRWMLGHPHATVALDSFDQPKADLNHILKLTLPALEHSETTADCGNHELMDALKVPPARRLPFLVQELSRHDGDPLLKDHLYDSLDVFLRIRATNGRFSKARNRLTMPQGTVHQKEIVKTFDVAGLINTPLPAPRAMNSAERDDAIRVLKNTMALTVRETDPCTYLEPGSLRIVDLERGLACAVFGMTPDRQLPLESYVGFTLFKNGLPVAYGGAWIFGPRAAFGMNIFEPYRGGESGCMMAQVLRTYRQTFHVDYFEVDAHQFGLDNPEGIASGAYWFYHRHGFRSIDAALDALATSEKASIERRPGYRSPAKTLLKLTGSNVALNFGSRVPMHIFDITTEVTRMAARRFDSNRLAMERESVAAFVKGAGWTQSPEVDEQRALREWAAAAAAIGVKTAREYELLAACVRAKPRDVLAYQDAVWAWQRETGRAGSVRLRRPVDAEPKRLIKPRIDDRRSVVP